MDFTWTCLLDMDKYNNNEKYRSIVILNKEIDKRREKYNITCKIQNTYVLDL